MPSGVFTNQDEPGGLFAVVLDEVGITVAEIRDVRRVAQRFFEQSLEPNDYVAVVRSGADSAFTLTTDRALALDAIANTRGFRERGLRLEQAGEAMTAGAPAELDGFTPSTSGRNSFDVLFATVAKMRPIQARRKAIVWFSLGGELNYDTFDALAANTPQGRADDRLTRLIAAARAANVAIYTVDPRGLTVAPTSTQPALDTIGTLRDLATATGGRALVNANDLNGALERVAEENRSYYLLGYANQADPKSRRPRKLQVRTRAPGVSLLHRSVIVPIGPNEKPAEVALAASPLPIRDLPITLAPAPVAGARGRRGIVVPFEIGTSLADGADVEYAVYAINAAGKAVSQNTGRGTAAGGHVSGVAQLAVTDGIYQVRVAASVKNSSTRGLAIATVAIPKGESEKPECAGFVFDQQGASAGFRRFSRERPLTITTLVSARTLGDVPLEFGLGSAGGGAERTWPATAGKPIEKGLWQLTLQLQAPLPRGVADIILLQAGAQLGEGCRTTFRME